MNIVIQKITEFYIENQLESDEIVGWLMLYLLIHRLNYLDK
jgi:hypothetical protein